VRLTARVGSIRDFFAVLRDDRRAAVGKFHHPCTDENLRDLGWKIGTSGAPW
jgi:hypothetical protein